MLERLLAQLPDLALLFAVSIICGLMESVIMPQKRGLQHWLILFAVSSPIAVIIGGIAMEYKLPDFVVLGITAISAIMARDGLQALLLNKGAILAKLNRAADNLVDKFTK